MGQRRQRPLNAIIILCSLSLSAVFIGACRKNDDSSQTLRAAKPSVVSLVPAATSLIVAMNAGDHLAAVSNYDQLAEVAKLARVGDYLTTDWERITLLHPDIVLTQYAPDRTPAGFTEHLNAVHSRQENLHIDRLADVLTALEQLGNSLNEKDKAKLAAAGLQARLSRVRASVAGKELLTALIVVDETGRSLAGPDTFLDDLLVVAGGKNALEAGSGPWPALDQEKLLASAPQVIIQLLPDASPQVRAAAMRDWQRLASLPAVRNHRVIQLTDTDVLLPGYGVGRLAEQFADALHPDRVKS